MADTRIPWATNLHVHVVPADKLTGPAIPVEAGERPATPTGAEDRWVGLARIAESATRCSMPLRMMGTTAVQSEVFWAVVSLLAVPMMYLLTRTEKTAKRVFDYEPMLIHIATRICCRMRWALEKHIAIGGNRSSALPVRVSLTGKLSFSQWHIDSVAQRNQLRKGAFLHAYANFLG